MKRTMHYLMVLGLVISVMGTSCKKGDAGPAGEQGEQGPQGEKGDAGSANVIYSPWFDLTYDAVTNTAGDTVYYYDKEVAVPKLTADILSKGAVKVYLNAGSSVNPGVIQVPYTDLMGFLGVYNINTIYSVGSIYFYATDNASTFTSTSGANNGLKVWQYRYVLIPGGVAARQASIDWSNYEEVKKQFDIND